VPEPLAALRGISKQFEGVRALDDVTIEFHPGQVHCLLGENGSGKSTAVKILTGAHEPTEGTVEIGGRPTVFQSPRDGLAAGIAAIYQDTALVPTLTVAENVLLGHEESHRGILSPRRAQGEAQRWLDIVDADLSPTRLVSTLSIAGQQLVAIAKALSQQASLLILDEPTAALGHRDADRLFGLVDDLRRRGLAIVYITHRLAEVDRLADVVTVLKDGRVTATRPNEGLSHDELVRLMVGRDIEDVFPERHEPRDAVMLEARDLRSKDGLVEVDHFAVRAGEIVGLAGLEGSGRSTLAQLLAGVQRPAGGDIQLEGAAAPTAGPGKAIRAGLGYVPPDRRGQAIVPGFRVASSITQSALFQMCTGPVLRTRQERATAAEQAATFGVKTPSLDAPITTLSGGNQQKVVLGRTLCAGARVLVCDEPTAGVDIGARSEIYEHIARLAREGMAVVVSSSDLLELIGLCHRIVAIREGSISVDVPAADATEESLMRAQLPVGSPMVAA
jgi:ABC-type sugar transport system ATPase subunit